MPTPKSILTKTKDWASFKHAVDGKPYYLKHRLPGNLNFSASPVGAADKIYLLSEEGTTIVLDRGSNIRVIAINKLNETFYASPAIVGDAIYLRGNKHLFCIKKSARPD